MRTQLLVALAVLIGGDVAFAQQGPASAYNPSVPGSAPNAQPSPASWGYYLTAAPPAPSAVAPAPPPVTFDAPMGVASSGGTSGLSGGVGWASAGYLWGWIPKVVLPTPLVTTGSTNDDSPGALREPNTSPLFGDRIDFPSLHGFQAEAGIFCDDERAYSIDGRGFILFQSATSFTASSNAAGVPVITRPIYDAASQQEAAVIDALPGVAAGGVQVNANSEIWGYEFNARCHVGNDRLRGELLVGFRYLELQEDLRINDQLSPLATNTLRFLGTAVNPPNSLLDFDEFRTRNQFYGGQIGGVVACEDWWYFLRLSGKVGFGGTEQRVAIDGSSTLVTPAGNTVAEGGILAQSTNIGIRKRTVFGIVPEWGVTGGVFVTDWLRLSGGYSVLFWSQVVRSGDVIDRNVNPGLVPTATGFGIVTGPPVPAFRWNDGSFWVQAVQANVELVY